MSPDDLAYIRRQVEHARQEVLRVSTIQGGVLLGAELAGLHSLLFVLRGEIDARSSAAPAPPPREEDEDEAAIHRALARIAELERQREKARKDQDFWYRNAVVRQAELQKAEADLADLRGKVDRAVVPLRDNRLSWPQTVREALAILTEAEGKTETEPVILGAAGATFTPVARSGDEPPVPATNLKDVLGQHAGVLSNPDREAAIRGLMDTAMVAPRPRPDNIVAYMDWYFQTRQEALAAARSAGIEGSANDG